MTPPYAKLRVSVNGGSPTTGAITCAGGDTIQFSAESTAGWSTLPRWELYGYPSGYTAPAGWSTDASGVIYSTANPPPLFTLPAVATRWGKWLPRLIVNASSIDPDTGAGTPISSLVDSSTAFQTKSPNGIADLADGEENQFGLDWTADQRANLRTIDTTLTTALAGGGGGSGVLYKVSPVGPVLAGQVAASYGGTVSLQTVQVATPAVIAAGNPIVGEFTENAAANGNVHVAPVGSSVDASITGLGAGAVARIGISATFYPVRLKASDNQPEVGVCDAAGNITIDPLVPNAGQAALLPFNPAGFGAVYGDGQTAAQQKANLLALNRTQAAMRAQPHGSHGLAITGRLELYDTFHIRQALSTHTIGGGRVATAPSAIIGRGFDEGIRTKADGAIISDLAVNAINCPVPSLWAASTAYVVGNTVRAPFSNWHIFKCTIAGTSGSTLPFNTTPDANSPERWSFGNEYAVGQWIMPSRNVAQYGLFLYECTQANGSAVVGHYGFVDSLAEQWGALKSVTGAVTAGGIIKLTSVAHGYTTGTSIVVVNVLGTTEANGTWTITVVDADHYTLNSSTFTNAYVSGGKSTLTNVTDNQITWLAHPLNIIRAGELAGMDATLQIADGGASWIPEAISGIRVESKADIYRVSPNNWVCGMIDVYSHLDGPFFSTSNCNGALVRQVDGTDCGAGIRQTGFNSNGNSVSDCYIFQTGIDPNSSQHMPGYGGNGYEDGTLLGCIWSNCLTETSVGRSYIASEVGNSQFHNCYTDGSYLPCIYRQGTILIAGVDGGHTTDGTVTILGNRNDGGTFHSTSMVDRKGAMALFATPIRQSGTDIFPWSSNRESSPLDSYTSLIGRRHDNFWQGWYFQDYTISNSVTRRMSAISGARSDEGLGNEWNQHGQFEGLNPVAIFHGWDGQAGSDVFVRGGDRIVGDLWRYNPQPNPGDFTYKICVTAGTIGQFVWPANTASYVTRDTKTGTPGTTTNPGDGFTYLLTQGGTSSGTPPSWAANTTLGPRAQVWAANKTTWPGDLWRPTDGSGFYFKTATPTAWSPSLHVPPNGIVCSIEANGKGYDCFQARVPIYSVASHYQIGYSMVQPTDGNLSNPGVGTSSLVMRVKSVRFRGIDYTFPGAFSYAGTEPGTLSTPAWPTTAGVDITVVYFGNPDYSITWTSEQLITGAQTPSWANDNNLSTVAPLQVGILDNNIVWTRFLLNTGPTEPASWDHSSVGALTASTAHPWYTVDQVYFTGPTQTNFAYVNTFPTTALVTDNTRVWMRIAPEPVWANYSSRVTQAGTLNLSVAGSANVTLTKLQANYERLTFSGVLTGNINVIVPTVDGWRKPILNNTTGAFTLTVKTTAGTGVALAQTFRQIMGCDGTNIVAEGAAV